MDDRRLATYAPTTGLIVPTRSLANGLSERVAHYQIKQGVSVWATPSILVWADYLKNLWQLNRDSIAIQHGAVNLISASQAALLWTQVIDMDRREESELALLNVQQTSKAVQRSWKLMHDWRIASESMQQDHVADTEKFLQWSNSYQTLLSKRGLIDESMFMTALLGGDFEVQHPVKEIVWVSYDLVTKSQQDYIQMAQTDGVDISFDHSEFRPQSQEFLVYTNSASEIKAALSKAKNCVESDPSHNVNVVIPDLQDRLSQVSELAREVFYPNATPLEIEQRDRVYAIGLGQKMLDTAAIEAAISLIKLFKNKTNVLELGFLLRNRFVGLNDNHKNATRLFVQWLMRQRIHSFLFDQLPSLYEQCQLYFAERDTDIDAKDEQPFLVVLEALVERRQSMQSKLSLAKENHGFAALAFNDWVSLFNDWLSAWEWRTNTYDAQMSSTQYQLHNRWIKLMAEFASLATVQRRAGLNRAIELIAEMARNTVFTPQCAASPIMISGVLEAIGRQAETCILTGMNQDYPAPMSPDAFISNRFLIEANHPQASAENSFLHAQKVMTHLLGSAKHSSVSYAVINDNNPEIAMHASPLFRNSEFSHLSEYRHDIQNKQLPAFLLEQYQDTQGPAWSEPGRAKGGSRIFENQSNCAFKAFVTHQLGFLDERETEFGLDALDRGNIVHHLLDVLWEQLQTQEALLLMSLEQRESLINRLIEQVLNDDSLKLSHEKLSLLQHERGRLRSLLMNCLEQEAKRPLPFTVMEREEQRIGELAGIQYKYIIDRLDLTSDGQSVIIDYKTGSVHRNDWLGERIKRPQMPLYVLAIDEVKNTPVSGIAYAEIKQGGLKYIELSEAGVFRKETATTLKTAQQWQQHRQQWPGVFEQLAHDFLAGKAMVNPVDKSTCQYCQLQSMCRVSQFRSHNDDGVVESVEIES